MSIVDYACVYEYNCAFVFTRAILYSWRYSHVGEASIGHFRKILITCTLHVPSYLQRTDIVTARAQL